jgi:hypothetical protein
MAKIYEVKDGNGKVLYRGTDIREASRITHKNNLYPMHTTVIESADTK